MTVVKQLRTFKTHLKKVCLQAKLKHIFQAFSSFSESVENYSLVRVPRASLERLLSRVTALPRARVWIEIKHLNSYRILSVLCFSYN